MGGWTRSDMLAAWGVGITAAAGVAGTWAALFSPQFQNWWKRRSEEKMPITLGNLVSAEGPRAPSTPGMIKADQETLKDILAGLPSQRVQWLHFQNFGDGFWLSRVTGIQNFALSRTGPEHEFLDKELEQRRSALWEAIERFAGLIATYTFSSGSSAKDTWMRIPHHEGGDEDVTDRRFFEKAGKLNAAAEDVWDSYQELIRKARLTLALSDVLGGDE